MTQTELKYLSSAAGLSLALITAPHAHAQLLPGVTDQIGSAVSSVEAAIADRIPSQIDGIELPDRIQDDVLGPVLSSEIVGNTLRDTLELGSQLTGAIRDVGSAAFPDRPIDLDEVDGYPVIRNEWVLLAPSASADEIRALDLTRVEETALSAMGDTLFVIQFEGDAEKLRAMEAQMTRLGGEVLDRNHVYSVAAVQGEPVNVTAARAPEPSAKPSANGRKLGMIDTDIDERHRSLSRLSIIEKDFVSHGLLRPMVHGTAVASVLAREAPEAGAELLAASAFFVSEDGTTGAATSSLLAGLDWLISEGAGVINVSLTGPPNAALGAYIAKAQTRGVIFVAAVGNGGPASGPLFPAAYEDVVGVTAVDENDRIYRWANRGAFVDIAAYGVNVPVAKPVDDTTRQSGTSFASPVVSAYLAGWTDGAVSSETANAALARAVGWTPDKGKDDVLGVGILKPSPK